MRRIPLKPSILILHDVSLTGNVSYKTTSREEETNGKNELVKWETTREIQDKPEHDRARALRARIKTALKTATKGAISDIGLFAPDIPQTFEAITEAEKEIIQQVDEFNSGAYYSRIYSQIITFQITSDNAQALQAISQMITNGLTDLKAAVKAANPDAIRDVLKEMKGLDALLPDAKSEELKKLMDAMKKKARDITKEIKKAGRQLDESELMKFTTTTGIQAAEMRIFDEIPETGIPAELMTGATAQELSIDFTAEAAPTPTTETPRTDSGEDYRPDNGPETAPQPVNGPTAEELQTAAATALQPDQTPEGSRLNDWTDPEDEEVSEQARQRADLIEIMNNSDSETREAIRAELAKMDAENAAKV